MDMHWTSMAYSCAELLLMRLSFSMRYSCGHAKAEQLFCFTQLGHWVMRSNVHCNGRSCQSAIEPKKSMAITTIKKDARIVRKVGANPNEYECSSMSMGGCLCARGRTTGMATIQFQAWTFFDRVHALPSVFRQLPWEELERVFFSTTCFHSRAPPSYPWPSAPCFKIDYITQCKGTEGNKCLA